jgi:hypothetical protein
MADRGIIDKMAEDVTKRLADQGKLIEAGYAAFRLQTARDPDRTDVLRLGYIAGDDLRLAYIAGAAHCYSSLMAMLDPGQDETAAYLSRMEKLHDEIQQLQSELTARLMSTRGKA